jgi:hypothetical protein
MSSCRPRGLPAALDPVAGRGESGRSKARATAELEPGLAPLLRFSPSSISRSRGPDALERILRHAASSRPDSDARRASSSRPWTTSRPHSAIRTQGRGDGHVFATERSAITDGPTGLYNRPFFDASLRRSSSAPAAYGLAFSW